MDCRRWRRRILTPVGGAADAERLGAHFGPRHGATVASMPPATATRRAMSIERRMTNHREKPAPGGPHRASLTKEIRHEIIIREGDATLRFTEGGHPTGTSTARDVPYHTGYTGYRLTPPRSLCRLETACEVSIIVFRLSLECIFALYCGMIMPISSVREMIGKHVLTLDQFGHILLCTFC